MKRTILALLIFPLIAAFASLDSPTEKGNAAFKAGRYDEAMKRYEEAARDNPDAPEAHYNLGGAYYKSGDYRNALKEYQEALRLDPKMPEALYNSGDAFFRLGQYDEALKAYREAESLKKEDPDTRHNIEVTLGRVKKKTEAEKKGPKNQGQGQQKPGTGTGGGQGMGQGQGGGGEPPSMSNEEVQALLDRQAKEEKALRNYFRPGRKDASSDREAQIQQILRGMGMAQARGMARPGSPQVEKDW